MHSTDEIYTFSNGVRVCKLDLIQIQIERYGSAGNPNLHEPIEEEWILRTFEKNRPPAAVFLDVGAAIGYYSILLKKTWADTRVYAVEALPRHAAAFTATVELNGLGLADFSLIQAAVGPADGQGRFIDDGYGSKLTLDHSNYNSVAVPMCSLNSLLKQLPPVHLMKMDIQGSELDVLAAARTSLSDRRIRHVLVGTHGENLHRCTARLLGEVGYDIVYDDQAPAMQPDGLIVASLTE